MDFATLPGPGDGEHISLMHLTDGRVSCCICFDFFQPEQLSLNEEGKRQNVCQPCWDWETSHPGRDAECAHCLRPLKPGSRGYVDGEPLCHTGTVPPQDRPLDCYRLVTVYGERLGSRICGCCTFGNHDTRCTCDGIDCCHPERYLEYNPEWGHGKGAK